MKRTTKKITIISLIMLICLSLCFAFACGSSPAKYKVTFDADGGTPVPVEQTIESGKLATKPEDPTKTATTEYTYTFDAWYNGETVWNFETDIVTKDVTLKAHYNKAANEYTATIKYSYSENVETVNFNVENRAEKLTEIESKKPTDTSEYSYTFNPILPETLPLENVEYTVNRSVSAYTATIKYDYSEEVKTIYYSVENRDTKLAEIKALKPIDTDKYSYAFNPTLPETLPLENVEYTITRTINKYTVTFISEGEQYGEVQNIEYGNLATMPEDPTKESTTEYTYTFDAWYNGDTKFDFATPVTENITLTAHFNEEKKIYTVIFDTKGGTAQESQQVEAYGLVTKPNLTFKMVHSTLTVQGGYFELVGWYNGDKEWNFETDKVTSDIILTAHWECTEIYPMPV